MSTKSEQTKDDCLGCRLASGGGIIAIGAYLYLHSHKRSKIQMATMRILAAGAVGLGIARLLNFNFLKSKNTIK